MEYICKLRSPARWRNAFTLLELLIVLVVIAVLVSLLLPALHGIREHANTTKDISNLRQLGIAIGLFHNDHGYVPGEQWPATLDSKYLSASQILTSPFDRRGATETAGAVSYDINSSLWGIDTLHVISASDCILAAPLTEDVPTLRFSSTMDEPSLPLPLNRESNGSGSTGGTARHRTQIPVLFVDMHAAVVPMSTFHSTLPNPNTGHHIADIRWNESGATADGANE